MLQLLRDPEDGSALSLAEVVAREGEEIVEGTLIGGSRTYPIRERIPRFGGFDDAAQEQTKASVTSGRT
jgi:hypothetical protein